MLKVVADSNIWISAFNFGGSPRTIIDLAAAGVIQLVISDAIFDEVWRVQNRKFGWSPQALRNWRRDVLKFTTHVQPSQRLQIVEADPEDNRILECARCINADYIVSGDNDLLRLQRFDNARILKPAEFLELLVG